MPQRLIVIWIDEETFSGRVLRGSPTTDAIRTLTNREQTLEERDGEGPTELAAWVSSTAVLQGIPGAWRPWLDALADSPHLQPFYDLINRYAGSVWPAELAAWATTAVHVWHTQVSQVDDRFEMMLELVRASLGTDKCVLEADDYKEGAMLVATLSRHAAELGLTDWAQDLRVEADALLATAARMRRLVEAVQP